jgi:hypothetical protein
MALGINKLSVKFDQAEGNIVATYDYANKVHHKIITFEEIDKILGSQGADSSIESPHPDKPA